MSAPTVCPRCDTRFDPAASPGGLCPACLLRLAVEADPDDAGGETGDGRGSRGTEPLVSGAPTVDFPGARAAPGPDTPERIGPYRILCLLGEGGMGAVYLAEQERPLRRRVAVKVIKLGMDTHEVVARFETERQMLAMMSHPYVAKVFEAGATERGRPYFVMEYVDGTRITDYCDRERLTVRRRLDLFVRVCGAVQHAHQKGIIHRDLKPSNVLIEVVAGEPTPKVIDFGVAKATGPGLPNRTLLTRLGAMVGTPAYMSPEAARGGALEVDSRTDIYALGVLLYELLCGCLPFDPDRLQRSSVEEVQRMIREEDPPPPSQRVAALGALAGEVAGRRGTDPAALHKRLRGDLDWIVTKAMEKDRARRYASASELAADILRHLNDQTVTAGPPGAGYRFGKLVRRHRFAVAAAAAVFLVLLLGIAGTTAGLLRARAAERTAVEEAHTARAVSDFLVGLFEVSDPGEARGNTVTAREILDEGAREIREELREQPLVRARLLATMGSVYRKLGLYDDAAALLEESIRVQRGPGNRPADRARDGPDPGQLADTLQELGTLEVERGRLERGQDLLERSLEILRETPGVDEARMAAIAKELAVLHYRKGDFERAEPLYRESLEIARRTLGPEDPLVAWVVNDLGNIAMDREQYDEAEALFRRSLEIHETVYGPDHPYVANNLNNLANSFQYQGEYERALPLRERAQAIYEKVLGPDHRLYALGLTNMGRLYHGLGAFDDAERLYRTALETRERMLGPEHPDVAVSLFHLAGLDRDRGRYDRAGPLYERSLAVAREALGDDHPVTLNALQAFAALHRATGDLDDAEGLLRRALDILGASPEPLPSRLAAVRADLASVCVRQGRLGEASDLLEGALAVERELHARTPDHRLRRADLASGLLILARLQELRGEDGDARRSREEALELVAPAAAASDAVEIDHVYALALLRLGRAEEARPVIDALLAKGWRHPDLLALIPEVAPGSPAVHEPAAARPSLERRVTPIHEGPEG